jgi:esterase/lipase superfamily enzyme
MKSMWAIGAASGRARLAAAALLAAMAAGCASPPEGVLVPVSAAAPGAAQVDMLAATTRQRSADPGVVFNGERGDAVSFEEIAVSIPPNRAVGSVQWPRPGAADPSRDFAAVSLTALRPGDVAAWVGRHAEKSGRVLVFVHGYNTRFDRAVFDFAQLVHDMGTDAAPVLFSWPSRGRLLDYNYDRESANFSRSDLADLLSAVARSPKVRDVVVFAHSMGAWLTVEALRQIALEHGRVPGKISNLILASPDLDIDVFGRQVAEMGPDRPLITIFVSRHDRALALSSLIAGGVTRVGAVDLGRPEHVAQPEPAPGTVVLDLSALRTTDRLNHSKFATSPDVVRLLGDRLIAGQQIGAADIGAGAAAQAVGNVVAAPIVLFTGGLGD